MHRIATSSFSLLCALMFFVTVQAQETTKATSSGIITEVRYVPSIAEQLANGTFEHYKEPSEPVIFNPKKRFSNRTIPGKDTPDGADPLVDAQRNVTRYPSRDPLLVFHADQGSNSTPTDPTCAVGPDHFLGAWNSAFRIFDKEGNPLTPEASLATVLTGNSTGDPIVLYDHEADRFIITEFDGNPNGFEMAICEGPDPVNDGWFVYLNQFTTGSFPDYTKFSIWSDAYYVTANINNGANGDRVWAVERDKMLAGQEAQYVGFPLPGISTSGFYSPQAFNVTTGSDMPPPGNATIVYLQDNAWFGVSQDHVKLWTVNVDWSNTNNSTISAAQQLNTAAFTSVFDGGSFSNFDQPSGPDVDGLQATIMNQAQWRSFPGYNSAVFNFLVDAAPGSAETGAIRWYELRQDAAGDPWEIYQEGTYVSPAGNKNSFGASMCMDDQGNIGMGYTTVSSSENPAIYYTGRLAGDPLGIMTVDETLIAQGSNSNPSNRLADYTHCVLDPSDGKTFWHMAEYFDPGRDDVVGVFKIAPDFAVDVGIVDILSPTDGVLSATEPITVAIRNFGIEPQFDIPVSFSVDGASPVMELYTDTIPATTTVEFTFMATVDASGQGQTYDLFATTELGGDQDNNNDPFEDSATNLDAVDVGVLTIISPETMPNGGAEAVGVEIQNFGGEPQSNFPISYSIDGGAPVTETFTDVIPVGGTETFVFGQLLDIEPYDMFTLTVETQATNDAVVTNNSASIDIVAINCIPESVGNNVTDGCEFDGIRYFEFNNVMNSSDCESDFGVVGYGNFIDQVALIDLSVNPIQEVTVETAGEPQTLIAWIDFNDNGFFTINERVLDPIEVAAANQPEVFELDIPANATLGEHIMRIRASDESSNTQSSVNSPCGDISWGETEDYKVDITSLVGLDDIFGPEIEMEIIETTDDFFQVSMTTGTDVLMTITVVDPLGQTVVSNRVQNINGTYSYPLDMTYAAAGIYLVRMGNELDGKVEHIVVD